MRDERSLDEKLAPQDFVADFVWAARAVLSQPVVALGAIAIWWLPIALPLLSRRPIVAMLVCVAALAFDTGWAGAERMFFLRRREGESVTVRDLFGAVPTFMGRFVRLGCLLSALVGPVALVGGYLAGRFGAGKQTFTIATVTLTVAFDLVLTFVPSALVFTTTSAREALKLGVRMIGETWPRSGLYVLCPPLALGMLNTIYPTDVPMVHVATTAALALLMLFAKGATAAFYLRVRPMMPAAVGAPSEAPVQAQ